MLRLRPFRSGDAKTIINWTSESYEFYKWSAGILGEYPLTEERFIEAMAPRFDSEQFFPFTAFDETGIVGFILVRIPGEDNKKARFGFVIVNPENRNLGYGKKMLALAIKYTFEVYGADSVSLGVFEDNPGAYYCYRSMGFEETGARNTFEVYGNNMTVIEMILSNNAK